MRAFLLLAAAATLSHAYLYPAQDDSQAAQTKSVHFRRMPSDPNSICAPKAVNDSVKYQTLNTTDVANAEHMLYQWASAGAQIENSGGSKGKVVTSGGVDAQVCNLDHSPLPVTTTDLMVLFDIIDCGSRDQPQMGFGFYHKLGNSAYYVGYAPTGQLMNCFNDLNDLKGAD